MKNTIDYYNHKTYTPPYYHRQYENDLPQDKTSSSYAEVAKRTAHIALPFLSLYRPLGTVLSLTMGSVRVITSGVGVAKADDLPTYAYQGMQVGLATLALLGTLYHFTLGLYITTAADLMTNLVKILERLYQLEYKQAGDELLQALASGLYLAIIMTGSMEVILTSLLVQALVSFIQARDEWKEGRIPEAMAKTLMGMIRLYQGGQQFELIQKRNDLFKRYEELTKRIQNGRKTDHLYDHPAVREAGSLHQMGENPVVLEDANGNPYEFGAHFHGYGKQQVKGMNISFRKEGGKTTLEFKVNHVFRDRLQNLIVELKDASPQDLADLLQLNGSHIEGISITKKHLTTDEFWMDDLGDLYEVHLQGLGKISIGASKEVVSLYDRVTVEMDKGKNLYDFHEALSMLNLDDALRQSATDDIDRMKMGHLFRMFAPREATLFERTDPFFDLPIDQFKKEILTRSPEMAGVFDEWISKMELREILPGRMRWAVNGLADELQNEGTRGLTAGLMGAWTDEEMKERVASILKMGMLSHETRDRNDFGANGLSWGLDYYTGGVDNVYTQIVNENNRSFKEYLYYDSPIRFAISPKILESGSYQYHDDNFGVRIVDSGNDFWFWEKNTYLNRDNIFDFVSREKQRFSYTNEVMIKERIPPEYFTGIILDTQARKQDLLQYLREKDLVQMNAFGQETILSRLVDEFLYVGNQITDEQFI